VIDLTQLDALTEDDGSTSTSTLPVLNLMATVEYDGFRTAHNLTINEDTGLAYVVGSDECRGELYIIYISDETTHRQVHCGESQNIDHNLYVH